jgi:hypothetical protein
MMKRSMRQRKPKPEVLPSFKERRFEIADRETAIANRRSLKLPIPSNRNHE